MKKQYVNMIGSALGTIISLGMMTMLFDQMSFGLLVLLAFISGFTVNVIVRKLIPEK
ncbi:hypothetical protein [Weissella ceti]|uniref:hypothetical protein n=1 Tax=Weissella ceti TaxID=759620 RepID=UPI001BCD53AC|nr:hypothetical protein [Weissella ceti]QVK11648.1 hypothetical protein KHQ31_05345 [Weissella ceti]